MNKSYLLSTTFLLFSLPGIAQVDDVSITVTPTIGYNWFDAKSTIQNGAMYGVQAGFGFGKVVELRAVYERSLDLKQSFGKYEQDIQSYFPNFDFANQNIDVKRIGGEFKTNIPVGKFSPYLILGTGMQTFEHELASGSNYKAANLYGNGGLGIKFNMGKRTTFNIEGRSMLYNMNPGNLLYNEGGSADFDAWINSQERNTMYNWSLTAGLQFYFGGRNESEKSAMDRAYLQRFSSGMSGTKLTFAPVGAYVQFDNSAAYRDTYLLGGMLGVDFTDFVGLKGYYYQATKDKKLSFDFDRLAMYGVDFVGKLNVPRGIVPYITVGGGYIHAQDSYQGKEVASLTIGETPLYRQASSGYYAKGGVGVEIPLSRRVQVFGAANLLYSMEDESADIMSIRHSSELAQHEMYNVGLRLNFGKRANTAVYNDRSYESRYNNDISQTYDREVDALEEELKLAYQNNDTQKAIAIIERKKAIDSLQYVGEEANQIRYIRLTPAELESLIDRVLDGLEEKNDMSIENRLDRIERLLLSAPQHPPVLSDDTIHPETQPNKQTDAQQELLRKEVELLQKELEEQRRNIEELRNKLQNNQQQPNF